MTKPRTRPRAKKCTIFFEPGLQRWLGSQRVADVQKMKGLDAVADLVAAISRLCLTGQPVGYTESEIEKLSPLLRPCAKLLLGGWGENNRLREDIEQAGRVEIRTFLNGGNHVGVEIIFFRKAREWIGSNEVVFGLLDGKLAGITSRHP